MAANPRCWVHCVECHHRDMIPRAWLDRRSRPRCARCGGNVEPSEAARRALVRGADLARTRKEQYQ
jgi:hypothetical protein